MTPCKHCQRRTRQQRRTNEGRERDRKKLDEKQKQKQRRIIKRKQAVSGSAICWAGMQTAIFFSPAQPRSILARRWTIKKQTKEVPDAEKTVDIRTADARRQFPLKSGRVSNTDFFVFMPSPLFEIIVGFRDCHGHRQRILLRQRDGNNDNLKKEDVAPNTFGRCIKI